jgi:PAS domain S-box-containing protein
VIDESDLPSMLAPPPAERRRSVAAGQLRILTGSLAQDYLWATAAASALFAVLLGWVPLARAGPQQPMVAATFGIVAVLAVLANLGLRRRDGLRVTAGGLLGLCGIGAAAVGLGGGASAPVFGFAALHAALAMALGGRRSGLVVSGAALLLIWGVALAEHFGWIVVAGAARSLSLDVLAQSLLVVLSAAGGWLAGRSVARFMRAADEREQRFRGLLALSVDAYWELDPSLQLQALSIEPRARAEMPTDDTAIGSVPWEHPSFRCDADVLDRLMADLGARQPVRDVPVAWRFPAGTRDFLVSGEPRFDHRGVFRGYWGVVRDVTDDLRAQQALALTETRYQDLFGCLPTPIVLHRDGRVLDANPAAAALFGFREPSAMLGTDLMALYEGGDSRERARRRMESLLDLPAGTPLDVTEYALVARDGRRLVVRATGVGVATPQGMAFLSIYVDDTERQQTERAVRRSEALLSHLVASSPDLISLSDLATGRYTMVNQAYERITGWKADEVVGRSSLDIGLWRDPADRDRFVREVRTRGHVQDMPLRLVRRDGSIVPILLSGARFEMDRREYLVVNARDVSVSERERLEREAILANASIGIAMTRDERFQWINPALQAMLGWPDGALVGQPVMTVVPDDAAAAALRARIGPALARGEQIEVECPVHRRDGSSFLCRMLARAVDPSHPSRGGTIWIVEDITERRRVDEALAAARDAAEAANRAKSAFLANTSHELRTPLNHVLGLAQLAREPGIDPAKRAEHLDAIVDSAQMLAQIVSDILDLSKIEAGQLSLVDEAFDLPALLQKTCGAYLAAPQAGDVRLALEVEPDIDWVRGDPVRVRQIVSNYLGNAFKFTAAGEIRVVARRAGALLRLEVHDTGIGIDPSVQGRLFRPFTQADDSTTRCVGGTGLGLSICRELAQIMGGAVGVDSTPGVGSCFWAELPLPAWVPPPPTAAPAQDDSVLPGARVLVVDDDDVNRLLATDLLRMFGARASEAADGQQALDLIEQAAAEGDPYHLVLMDLQMPVRSGFEVAAELRRRYGPQQLPIVAHTAAVLVANREAALAAGMNDFLPKPTSVDRMRRMAERWVRVQRGIDPPPPAA